MIEWIVRFYDRIEMSKGALVTCEGCGGKYWVGYRECPNGRCVSHAPPENDGDEITNVN